MRCYKKPFSWELVDSENLKIWGYFHRASPASDLPEWLYFVHVCSFRFVFTSFEQIGDFKLFYDQPRKPAFRHTWVDENGVAHDGGCDTTSEFARLPLYLWEKSKRPRVVAALSRAIRTFAKE